mmetsp:Transcript_9107/g.31390  ORF Transcript_9107/g.31390 Transcript_9107/m.31390 type:complete len:85 (+) Transcript_9107:328-582(+)
MESSRRERERERRMMMRGPGSSGSVLREKGPGRVFNIGTNPEDFDLEGDYMEVFDGGKEGRLADTDFFNDFEDDFDDADLKRSA